MVSSPIVLMEIKKKKRRFEKERKEVDFLAMVDRRKKVLPEGATKCFSWSKCLGAYETHFR